MDWEARVRAYLEANKTSLGSFTNDQIVGQIKVFALFGQNVLSDDQIRKIILNWSILHPILPMPPMPPVPGGGAPINPSIPPAPLTPNRLGPLLDDVKRAVGRVADGVTYTRGAGSVNIKATGVTGKLKSGSGSASASVSWSGTVGLKAESGPVHFAAEISKDHWEMSLTFPDDDAVPNLTTLPTVFEKGEAAMRKVVAASAGFSSISDVGKIGAVVKQNSDDLKAAVEAASGIPSAKKKSGTSFGFKLGSPPALPGHDGIQPGVQGTMNFTYWY